MSSSKPRSAALIKAQKKYFKKKYYEDAEFKQKLIARASENYYRKKHDLDYVLAREELQSDYYTDNHELILELVRLRKIEKKIKDKYNINLSDFINDDEAEEEEEAETETEAGIQLEIKVIS